MKRNFRVITINGFRGILMAAFVICGLIAGFIISPAWVCMKLWNLYVTDYFSVASMNIYQGLLLWAVIALFLYALNNKRSLIGFGTYSRLSNKQIHDIMRKARFSDAKIINDLESLKDELKRELENKESIENGEMKSKNEQETEQKEEIRG